MPALCLNFALYLTQAWPKDFYSHVRRFSKETYFYFFPLFCVHQIRKLKEFIFD